jgi:hypothetical protein
MHTDQKKSQAAWSTGGAFFSVSAGNGPVGLPAFSVSAGNGPVGLPALPQQRLYFWPDLQGQAAFLAIECGLQNRPTLALAGWVSEANCRLVWSLRSSAVHLWRRRWAWERARSTDFWIFSAWVSVVSIGSKV